MTAVQAVAIIAVAIAGSSVALLEDPLRVTFLLGIYGMTLAALFFALQAPDVALSEIVVGTIGLPLVILAALRKVRVQEREGEDEREQ
jgi:energy-converting hydrogenase B subunit D